MADHSSEHAQDVAHASVRTYLVIAAILTVVTLIEVATYFIEWFQDRFWLLFWVLCVLSLLKFWLVVAYYMHLRYDDIFYRRVFIAPLVIAVAITVVLVVLTAARAISL